MTSAVQELVANGRGAAVPKDTLAHLAMGTMVTTDLAAAQRMCEDLFGLECAPCGAKKLLVRDRRSKYLMEHGERDFFVIEVSEVESVTHPQANLNHWGFSVGSREEVDRCHALLKANMEQYRLAKVLPITPIHNAYGFYFFDVDGNWWEIEFRGGVTNDKYFSKGSFGDEYVDPPLIDPELPVSETRQSVIGPEGFLTHGTTDVVDVMKAQSMYEKVLGLRSVRHAKVAQFTAGGGDFAVVGVETGKRNVSQSPENRWILLVDGSEALAEVRSRALAAKDEFDIAEIGDVEDRSDGGRSFLIRSADDNWFEISTRRAADLAACFERTAQAA